jgi:hypothetical protein
MVDEDTCIAEEVELRDAIKAVLSSPSVQATYS